MKPSTPSETVSFDVNERSITLRISIDAICALVRVVEEQMAQIRSQRQSTMKADQTLSQGGGTDSVLMSIKDAASALGVSRPTIYKLLKGDGLRGVKLGGRTMIPTQGLRDYAGSLTTYAQGTPSNEPARPTSTPGAAQGAERRLRFKAVMALTGLSRRELFVRRNAGTFPKGVKLSSGVLGWDKSDVDAWIAHPTGYQVAEGESLSSI